MSRAARTLALLAAATIALAGCSTGGSKPAPTTQSVLPFTDLNAPYDVSVDATGNVFVSDIDGGRNGSNRVIELSAGSKTTEVLPFSRATVLTDPSGAVWVVDGGQSPGRLVKLAQDAGQPDVLPLPDLGVRGKIVAVDNSGSVYGVNGGGEVRGGGCCLPVHVVREAPGSTAAEVLPFQHVDIISGMATDAAGNLYVGDGSGPRVLTLAPGATSSAQLAFGDLGSVIDVAVDAQGAVYVVDGQQNKVLKLAPDATAPVVLPFDGLLRPVSVAVNAAGDVLVVDAGHKRIVELEGV